MRHLSILFFSFISLTVSAQHVCGNECSIVDHDFERIMGLRQANRNQDVFTKFLPIALHNINGAVSAEDVDAIWNQIVEGFNGTDIVPCKHSEFFYQEWMIDPDTLSYEYWFGTNEEYDYGSYASQNTLGDACNIFILPSIAGPTAGFSWINNNALTPYDGVYIEGMHAASKMMTHELGHYCGLYHTFEGGGCSEDDCATDGDLVCDTPPTYTNESCTALPFCEDADVTNYMDYTGQCRDHFTQGQIERMHAALVNGGRAMVWQSGSCIDPNSKDVAILSIDNAFDCDRYFYPEVRLANWTANDAIGVDVTVTMMNGIWTTTVDVPSDTIITVIGNPIYGEFNQEYDGVVEIYWSEDENSSNDMTFFEHAPKNLAVLNIDIQHDIWPESEQWKFYKEGLCCGDPIYPSGVYAKGGHWGSLTTYDSWDNGLTNEPLFTHDEICLSEGCYAGFFRHDAYDWGQWVFDTTYADIVTGVHIWMEYGEGGATETLYEVYGDSENPATGSTTTTWNLGNVHGGLSEHEYVLCTEADYDSDIVPFDCVGDFDGNGAVDLQDFLQICMELGKEGAACVCDTDEDNDVDLDDFLTFISVYGTDCSGGELPPPTVRQLEELGLNPKYYSSDGKEVRPGPNPFGIYLAEIEVEGIKHTIKVVQ